MKGLKPSRSHHEEEIVELAANRGLAIKYLKAALESLDDPETAQRACWHLRAVAAEAGISRESLYRALSPNGNLTLKTLLAVLKTVGLRLLVESETCIHA